MITLTPGQSYLAVAGVAVISAGLGGVGGYIVANKRLKNQYADLAEEEIQQAKIFYQKPDLADLARGHDAEVAAQVEIVTGPVTTLEQLTRDYRTDDTTTTVAEIQQNIFEREAGVWDYEVEHAKRDEKPDDPYIIHHDEFMENAPEHDQITVSYFVEDEVLVDEHDNIIQNEELVLGEDNLQFGHGSKDNNIVYIRNEASNTDFEVLRSTGSYSSTVLGIKHSDYDGRPRKFRLDG